MNRRVLAIGECMVELAPAGSGLFRQGFAGDTFNMAWYLRRLLPADWPVDYVTAVGDDPMSLAMLDFMRASGIGTSHVFIRKGGSTGLYLISIKDGERSFSYWRGQSSARSLARDETELADALQGAELIVLSGITLAILPADDRQRLLAALATAKRAGSQIAFDPNLRLRLWPDPCVMRAAVEEAVAVADTVLPSYEDEKLAFGDPSPEATIERYRRSGANDVVVKNGAGAIHWSGTEGAGHWLPPPAASVVDTTAAGDSFNAGFLSARLTGHKLTRAVQLGAEIAACVIGAPGALVALQV
ncbi:MAG: sugar kinase [Rhodobacteraceae bacterium]|nr:sugar kinase [Paracoccaceae bacterium]